MRHSWGRSTLLLALVASPSVTLATTEIPVGTQPAPVPEGQCGGAFGSWLAVLRAEAAAQGISPATLALLDGIAPDPQVLALDRSQRVFGQDWRTFSGRMVNRHRLTVGERHLREFAAAFAAAEAAHGVPGAVIAAFWGLETDFGAVQGHFGTLSALATLAHDCRRPSLFRPQLIAALRLVEQGALEPKALIGAWAGELGQIQLLPTDYLALGTDGDGDGRGDLKASKPDVIATGAHYLAQLGWRRGEPWLSAVQIPEHLPWQQVGLQHRLPRAQWAALGVLEPSGVALPADGLPAALLLPMGRLGPAFLAYDNFQVFLRWNQSLLYSTTAAYLATRLAGAPPVEIGEPEPGLDADGIKALQARLQTLGHDLGAVDGILGAKTRAAVQVEQTRLGLAADAWPTPELLRLLLQAPATDPPDTGAKPVVASG